MERILSHAQEIIHLLTGEIPIKCDDVAVYFSLEEWEYIEGHKEIYKDVMMENHQALWTLGIAENRSSGGERVFTICLTVRVQIGDIERRIAALGDIAHLEGDLVLTEHSLAGPSMESADRASEDVWA
ncbi:oocyte zinc finger protein XlCOF7.2-like [Discoglossus pictus]